MLTNCLAAERDICAKIVILSYPLHSTPRLREFPSEYRHPVWYGKTRMVRLPDGEKIEDIYNGLDTIPACDRQTDGQTNGHLTTAYTRYAYASRSKNCAVGMLKLEADYKHEASRGLSATAELLVVLVSVCLLSVCRIIFQKFYTDFHEISVKSDCVQRAQTSAKAKISSKSDSGFEYGFPY